jgi:hypothetical protein
MKTEMQQVISEPSAGRLFAARGGVDVDQTACQPDDVDGVWGGYRLHAASSIGEPDLESKQFIGGLPEPQPA